MARVGEGREPVRIGIGGHYGEVFAGAIGSERLLEFTVLGDTVNIAERLERLCIETGAAFVISDTLFERAGGARELTGWTALPARQLAGRAQEIDCFMFAGRVTGQTPP